jgi:serine/threonine protein kinase
MTHLDDSASTTPRSEEPAFAPSNHPSEAAKPIARRRRVPTAPGLPKEGDSIKHYELMRELGKGGMGTVFVARDTKIGRLVALKLLTRLSGEGAKRFLAEAHVTARCKHDNIVVIHEVDEHDGHPYMVLEYIEGQTLRAWMDARRAPTGDPKAPMTPVPPSLALSLIVPVLRALARAHKRGIVHRDLKPANIMIGALDALGTIKLLDFGIAKTSEGDRDAMATTESALLAAAHGLTPDGATPGTPAYMAPEQWRDETVDPRADLWAVGIILYELLTGVHPLAPCLIYNLASVGRIEEPMPSLADACPGLGPLAALVDRCLKKPKDERIASANDILHELETLMPEQLDVDQNPFTGLAAFQEEDAPRFFGRERDLTIVMGKLQSHALLTISGPSGAGKSSFVRAALIPALKRAGQGWEELIIRPGRHPLAGLSELCAKVSPASPHDDAQATLALLREEPGHLGAILRAHCRKTKGRLLLFVDQLEELYTLGAPVAERAAFAACLTGAADDASSPVRVVLSIRSDFLDKTGEDPRIALKVTLGLSRLLPMGRGELREVLTRPVLAARHRFESDQMVDRILDELTRPGSPLPLLQFTAAELWETRDRERRLLTLSSYEMLGGVGGALSTHADEVFARLSPQDQRLCQEVCLRLCTHERPRTRLVVSLSELRELSEDHAAVEQVVHYLADARLLLLQASDESEGEGTTVELVHESLIEGWAKLGQWLAESEQDAQFLARLRVAARQWAAGEEAEGLLWRDRAAEEAKVWLARWEAIQGADSYSRLGKREERYLRAVVALASRARRLRRWTAVGVATTLGVTALIVTLLAVRASREAAHARDESMRLVRAQQTMMHAADFAAHRVAELSALHFDRYRAVVESAGQDPRVARALVDLKSPQGAEAWAQLFAARKELMAAPFALWTLMDADGKMVRRVPAGARNLIGRNYKFRDYFRGAEEFARQGRRRAYVSSAYCSENDDDYEFAISFPVHDGDRWVGVLNTAICTGSALGSIEFPGAERDGLNVTLISPRGRDRQGEVDPSLIFIFHPALGRGKTRTISPADMLGSGFVSRVPVRDTPFFALVSVTSDGPSNGDPLPLTP